jgi:hypothetical protein
MIRYDVSGLFEPESAGQIEDGALVGHPGQHPIKAGLSIGGDEGQAFRSGIPIAYLAPQATGGSHQVPGNLLVPIKAAGNAGLVP